MRSLQMGLRKGRLEEFTYTNRERTFLSNYWITGTYTKQRSWQLEEQLDIYYRIFKAIRMLSSVYLTSRVVNECRISLNDMARYCYSGAYLSSRLLKLPGKSCSGCASQTWSPTNWCTNVVQQIYNYANLDQYGAN